MATIIRCHFFIRTIMLITIADINIELSNLEATLEDSSYIRKILQHFNEKKESKPTVSITRVKKIIFPKNMEKFIDYFYGENKIFFYVDSVFFQLETNIETGDTTFFLKKGYNITFYLLKVIKIAISVIIIRNGGIPFHSSAISDKQKAFAFSGISNSGKTTICNLLSDNKWKILNDEFNIVMPKKNGYNIFSTPFTTEKKLDSCNNISAPLENIFFLNKAKGNYLNKRNLKKNYFQLLENIYTIPSTKQNADKILENAHNICDFFSPEILYFKNDYTINIFWNNKVNKK